jgi:adenylate cyclase
MIYRFGAFTLDTETFELKSGVDTITAEPKVFLLLKYLIENRARVLSRDDIIDAVWDGRAVSESSLTYAIKEARRLTGDDGKTQAVIRTLPRLGFRFVAEVTEGSDAEEAVAKQESGASPFDHFSPANRRWRIPVLAAALVLVAIVAGDLAWRQPWVNRVEAASIARMAFPLPEKPSIAVLQFDNLNNDPKQDFLADGISETITTALSQSPDLFVIARTSTLSYKGKPVKVQQVSEELGVRYVLEGSVQQSGDRVRVTAQLIDALSGRHLWAESYDREVEDAFALQDEIALNVLSELEVKLTQGQMSRITRSDTNSLEAYQLLRRGFPHFWRQTEEENAEARRLFQKATEVDPNFATAWYMVGNTHEQSARFGWGEDPVQDGARAKELAEKAIAIDPSVPGAYNLLSQISLRNRRHDEGIAFLEKAVALSPNSHIYLAILGRTLVLVGRPEEGLARIQQGIRRNPFTQTFLLRWEGEAYYALGRYEDAIAAFERARARGPKAQDPLVRFALTYADMGRMEEARTAAQEVLKLNPKFSAQRWVNGQFHKDPAIPEHFLAILRQLGLPE